MRRTVRAVAATLLAAVVVLAPLPASAADPIPGPVVDIPELPSVAVKRAGTMSPIQANTAAQTWRAMLVMTGKIPPAAPVTVPPPVVVAPAKPLTNAAAVGRTGSAVGTAFFAGWALVDGGLAMYGVATGTEPLGGACTEAEWFQTAVDLLYMFSAPDCTAAVTNANAGSTATPVLTTSGGGTLSYVGKVLLYDLGWPYDYACLRLSNSSGNSANVAPRQYGSPQLVGGPVYYGSSMAGSTAGGPNTCVSAFGPGNYAGFGVYRSGSGVRSAVINIYNPDTDQVITPMVTPTANPTRTSDCKLKWPDGTTTTRAGSTYTESGGFNLRAASSACTEAFVSRPGHGPSLLPTEIEIGSTDDTGTRSIISNQPVPDFTTPQRESMAPLTSRGLVLQKVVGTSVYECNSWATDCSGWWTATSNGTTPGQYRCQFGGRDVALTECGPYRHTFDTKTNTPTITDPTTGTDVGWSAQPSTGNSINPGTGPGTGANPSDACFETGWAEVMNPVDWVLVPVKCALVWAFVPRPAVVQASTTAVQTAWADTMPVRLSEVAATAFVVPTGDGGCQGPLVDLPINLGATNKSIQFYPLDACSGVGATLAGLSTLISSAILIWATALGVVRRGSAVVNAPGIGSAG